MTATTVRVSILDYDTEAHRFKPWPSFWKQVDGSLKEVSYSEAQHAGVTMCVKWKEDYKRWNTFNDSPKVFKGQPRFSSLKELQEFNDEGEQLAQRLRKELSAHSNVTVSTFRPLYSSIEVGDAVASWWHIKDTSYGFVVPIQALPISDDLKSRLMFWRKCKNENLLDEECIRCKNEEGHDIEEHVLWELNVRFNETLETRPGCVPKRVSSGDSIESMDFVRRSPRVL